MSRVEGENIRMPNDMASFHMLTNTDLPVITAFTHVKQNLRGTFPVPRVCSVCRLNRGRHEALHLDTLPYCVTHGHGERRLT